ncbi:MAG: RagB/SusD family nutrient uptake outer membrane protein [Rikenellaceae bacterium]
MKKYIKNIALVSLLSVATTACNDSFLDRTPTHNLNDNSYWNTLTDLETYNKGIYNEAGSNYYYHFMNGFTHTAWSSSYLSAPFHEAKSDNFASMVSSHSYATEVAAGKNIIPSSPQYGGWYWTLLRRINVSLANSSKVDASEDAINMYNGEALFFRAWFYLDKVQRFGDVPYVTIPLETDSEELYGARDPRCDVMDNVLADINKAIDYLPIDWGDGEVRVNRGVALALKSRICLYEGTFRKYHGLGDYEDYLKEAVSASEELMGSDYSYGIYNTGNPASDYAALFNSDDLSGNEEMIFYRQYVSGLLAHRMCGYLSAHKTTGATKDFVEDFLCLEADGSALPVSLSTSFNDDSMDDEFDNRDARLAQTILRPSQKSDILLTSTANYPSVQGMSGGGALTGYMLIKYYDKEQDVKGYGKETHDAPLFRYAEVLLNLAEAKAELGTLSQTDLDNTVNLIRARAGLPDLTMDPVMDPKYEDEGLSAVLIEIRRERRCELSFEQLRFTDLMRWKWGTRLNQRYLGMRFEPEWFEEEAFEGSDPSLVILYEDTATGKHYVDPYAGTTYEDRSFDEDKNYYYPIPISAISLNSNLEQTTNW